jgi:hypothetical protein
MIARSDLLTSLPDFAHGYFIDKRTFAAFAALP